MGDMQAKINHSDLYEHGRLWFAEMRQSPKPQYPNASSPQTATGPTMAHRAQPLSDTVLKCLHRDDPLRHAYLRSRWRSS
jgi:hypothetical protein